MSQLLFGPGLGETQRLLLAALKRRGSSTLLELKEDLDLAPATLREHLQSLTAGGLVERQGTRRHARGRPEVIYRLAAAGDRLFPSGESELLQELVAYLDRRGPGSILAEFFGWRTDARREAARNRLAGLQGAARWGEVARILSEQGFMAEVVTTADGLPGLVLHHCPLRAAATVSDWPCRSEVALIEGLLGQRLERIESAACAHGACAYAPVRNL
jgi:predicted ArsR family transcriptional regulator